VLGGCVICVSLGLSAPAQAASAVGPYYAVPSWDQKLDAAARFIVLTNWASEAVLDRETRLVWERSPSTVAMTWHDAHLACNRKGVGNRKGWRLPNFQELASLVDTSVAVGPKLPVGHPFVNTEGVFWSATINLDITAWAANVAAGIEESGAVIFGKNVLLNVWCVRSPQVVPQQ
jgi:hypothetical protein